MNRKKATKYIHNRYVVKSNIYLKFEDSVIKRIFRLSKPSTRMKTHGQQKKALLCCIGLMSLISCCKDEETCSVHEKRNLKDPAIAVPYNEGQEISFLHNNNDTHTFVAHGKESYYLSVGGGGPKCPVDHQCLRIILTNQQTNENLNLDYVYDEQQFAEVAALDDDTFYKLKYKGKDFSTEQYDSKYQIIRINNTDYNGVRFIGYDTTSNFVAIRIGIGILKIVINGEKWERIPE